MQTNTDRLVGFLSGLTMDRIPAPVVDRTKDLILDWLGSALAGRGARPTHVMESWAAEMGPREGRAEILTTGGTTSPLFATLINGAASHVVEQDDVHNGSVVHPGATVIPAALAAAQDVGAPGADLIVAVVAGYEMAIRVGRYLGPSHYKIFHTSGTAGTMGAAMAGAKLLGLSEVEIRHALGSAGTQAAGLWEFLRDAADSKQLHTAKAGADGLLAAYGAKWGLLGARQILEGAQGMGNALSQGPRPEFLAENLGERWAILETSLKSHASCRHTHPSADALIQVMIENAITWNEISRIRARVHGAAIDVLEPAKAAATIHQSKFSMPFVLSLIARWGRASITDFTEENLRNPDIRGLMALVDMVLDPEVEQAYPERWLGRVEVTTRDGKTYIGSVDMPRGDPGNFLPHAVIRDKVHRLAQYGGIEDAGLIAGAVDIIENLDGVQKVPRLLS